MIKLSLKEVARKDVLKINDFFSIHIFLGHENVKNQHNIILVACMDMDLKIATACGNNHDSSQCNLRKSDNEGPIVFKWCNCMKKNYKN